MMPTTHAERYNSPCQTQLKLNVHENDFEPLQRTISGTPGAGFVSDVPNDDEFCNFIRMNIDDPFDDSRKTPSRLTERRSTAFCQEVDRCVVWGGSSRVQEFRLVHRIDHFKKLRWLSPI